MLRRSKTNHDSFLRESCRSKKPFSAGRPGGRGRAPRPRLRENGMPCDGARARRDGGEPRSRLAKQAMAESEVLSRGAVEGAVEVLRNAVVRFAATACGATDR